MRKKDLEKLKKLGPGELRKRVDDLRKQKMEASVKLSSGEQKNVRAVRNIRREIAQLKTLIGEKMEKKGPRKAHKSSPRGKRK